MPVHKDFKRRVRERMHKTGESYTAARAQLLRHRPTTSRSVATSRTAAPPKSSVDYAALAGMSDASVKKATGCAWPRWVAALDRVGAEQWPHRQIASYIREKYDTPSWWSQMVTVGYERIKGLRARGQKRSGAFAATRSKVFPVAVAALYDAFDNAQTRARWLRGVSPEVRRSTRNKSMRLTWPDGTSVALGFFAKGSAKSQVQLEHSKLKDRTDATERKAFWTARFDALSRVLAGRRAAG